MTNFSNGGIQPNLNTQTNNNQFQGFNMVPSAQQSFFQSPIGNIYSLNTASDINNIPVGNNLSVGLCLSEAVMYIKSYQNGQPVLLGYRLAPLEGSSTTNDRENSGDDKLSEKITTALQSLDRRLSKIEEKFNPREDKLNWQV